MKSTIVCICIHSFLLISLTISSEINGNNNEINQSFDEKQEKV